MATSNITNTITDPTGAPISGVPVTATLMPTAGFRVDAGTEVARSVSTTTDATGAWSLVLERNSNITPGTVATWYEVVEQIPAASGGLRVWTIQVGASNQSVLASLVTPANQQPTVVPPGTTFISQASGDARYQALGSLGSDTPAAETAGAAGTSGVSTSASRADHIHPAATGTPVAIGTALSAGVATTFARSDHVHTGPLGTLGYAQATANQGSITTIVDLTSLTATVTVAAGRRIKITGCVLAGSTAANDTIDLLVREGSTTLQVAEYRPANANSSEFIQAQAILTPTAGSHTYKLSMQRAAGTGTITMAAGATFPAFILVEDIGV